MRFRDFLPVEACVLPDHNRGLKEENSVIRNFLIDFFCLSGCGQPKGTSTYTTLDCSKIFSSIAIGFETCSRTWLNITKSGVITSSRFEILLIPGKVSLFETSST